MGMKPTIYFEDMVPGEKLTGPSAVVDKEEMVAFAKRWDPMPFHVDESAGVAAFGTLTASSTYILSLKQSLVHRLPKKFGVLASLGFDEVRFHKPVRPDDRLRIEIEWLERRVSTSNPDRGIVTLRFTLFNQHEETVMSHLDTVLAKRREFTTP